MNALDEMRRRAWHWSSADGHLSSAFEPAQRANSRRTGQLSLPEIEASDCKKTLVSLMTPVIFNEKCNSIFFQIKKNNNKKSITVIS